MCGPGGRNPAARDDAANISTQHRDPAPWDHTVFFKRESRSDTSRFYCEGVRRPLYNRLVTRSDYIYSFNRSGGPSDGFVDPWGLYPRGYLETHVSQAQLSPRNDTWANHWRVGINFGGDRPPVSHPHLRAHETGRNLLRRLLHQKNKNPLCSPLRSLLVPPSLAFLKLLMHLYRLRLSTHFLHIEVV